MVQRRSRRVAQSFARLSGGIGSFSAEERKLIPQLMELLSSGALALLLPFNASIVSDSVAPNMSILSC